MKLGSNPGPLALQATAEKACLISATALPVRPTYHTIQEIKDVKNFDSFRLLKNLLRLDSCKFSLRNIRSNSNSGANETSNAKTGEDCKSFFSFSLSHCLTHKYTDTNSLSLSHSASHSLLNCKECI